MYTKISFLKKNMCIILKKPSKSGLHKKKVGFYSRKPSKHDTIIKDFKIGAIIVTNHN